MEAGFNRSLDSVACIIVTPWQHRALLPVCNLWNGVVVCMLSFPFAISRAGVSTPLPEQLENLRRRKATVAAFSCAPKVLMRDRSSHCSFALLGLGLLQDGMSASKSKSDHCGGRCKLLDFLIRAKWHGRGRRFDPDQVHQFSLQDESHSGRQAKKYRD